MNDGASVVIPMAKAFGIGVITTVLTKEIANNVKNLNDDSVVVIAKEDTTEIFKKKFEKGHSVDVAIDYLGGEIMGKCIDFLTHGTHWIMIASIAGQICKKHYNSKKHTVLKNTDCKKLTFMLIWCTTYGRRCCHENIYKVLPITEAEAAQNILLPRRKCGQSSFNRE